MPEIQRQDVAYEFIVIPNDEGIPPRQPANDVRLLLLEHAHELGLLVGSLEATVAELGRGVDELEVDLLLRYVESKLDEANT